MEPSRTVKEKQSKRKNKNARRGYEVADESSKGGGEKRRRHSLNKVKKKSTTKGGGWDNRKYREKTAGITGTLGEKGKPVGEEQKGGEWLGEGDC